MNRIVIGSSNNELGLATQDKLVLDITSDTNILIEDGSINTYVFNVNDAKVNILHIRENKNDINYEINIHKGNVSFNSISYASGNVMLDVNLNKEKSTILVCNSVIAKDNVKYEVKVNHNSKHTNSDVYNNGITKENGTILFDVVSFAPKNSKYCKINQDSKIITLNNDAGNKINPVLLIDEFETEARHAAFIGNFNNEEMFYLKSRGLNEHDAKNLLISGLLVGTLDVCFEEKESLKKKLNEDWR